jgi:uncharacterized protein (DUF885 family)
MSGELGEFLDSYYRLRPVTATFTGVHDHDHRLPDWSPDGLGAGVAAMTAVRTRLTAMSPLGPSLHDVRERDRQLAISFLDVQLAEHASRHFIHANPSLAVGEAAFGVISLMTRPFAPAAQRAAAAIDRLSAIAGFLAGARQTLTHGTPEEWKTKSLRECRGVDALLGSGIDTWIAADHIDEVSGRRLRRAADAARAAFDNFQRWIANDCPAAPSSRYACGSDLFDLLLARGHWSGASRDDLFAGASDALDHACQSLTERAAQAGGWPAVQERLATAHPKIGDYLSTYQHIWSDCRERALDADLVTWPDAPIRYVPIPLQTREAAPYLYYLFYRSPAPFDRMTVHDYVVTPIDGSLERDEQERRLRATNTSVIKLNHVVHHGAIGHHVQNAHAYEGPSAIGQIAAVDCASRIGMFLGGTMAEGWACYATDLMDEIGFLTPDESLAQQHTRARLLARAVADIGLHSGRLTFDEVTAIYRDRIGMSEEAARAEACKNSMFPGTALMYWLGTDGLHRLRDERKRADGKAFSLRRFHDRVLSFGSIPVPLVARLWP